MNRLSLVAFLFVLGTGWGLTQPLSKIVVSTGHKPYGIIFWQLVVGVVLLGGILLVRGRGFPVRRQTVAFAALIALLGTLIPNALQYAAYPHLPGGVMSIIISMVPLLAFPVALVLGTERFHPLRLVGLALGLVGVALIAGPNGAIPGNASWVWVLVAVGASLFYALEVNIVARWGTAGLDAVQAMFGASVIGLILSFPIAVSTGQWIDPTEGIGLPELALALSSVVHALMYAGYVWLVGRAGPVFAAQSSYIVTGTGVLWSMLLLGERYPIVVWFALIVTLAGVFLVQPRQNSSATAT